MKILFDLQAIQPDSSGSVFHGGGEYARFYFEKFLELKLQNKYKIDCIFDGSRIIDSSIITLCKNNSLDIYDIKKIGSLNEFIDKNKYNTFYSALPYENYNKLELKNCVFIFSIHGLRTLEMPHDKYEYKFHKNFKKKIIFIFKIIFQSLYLKLKLKEFKNLLSIKNKLLITISNHSKYSILNFFPDIPEKDINVIYAPIKTKIIKFTKQNEIETLNKFKINKKNYFFIISANRWIKNPYRAIKAFDDLFSKGLIEQKVLVLGNNNPDMFKIKNKNKFVFDGYVSQTELEILYKNAFAFFYPTLNEGFGYPPIEAMKYGTPVITSAISATTEICQDNVLYFNPYSIDEMQNRILFLSRDNDKYQELTKNGINRYKTLIKQQEQNLIKNMEIIFGISK